MMRLFLALSLLCGVASAKPSSFFRDAATSPIVPTYDWTNSYSLILSLSKSQMQTDSLLCIVNATASTIAVVDWGDNQSNPPGGGTDAVTSPEVPIGPSLSFCVPLTSWGPYTFLRSMSGGNLSVGTVYGFTR